MKFSDNLVKYRKKAGLTQAQLASKLSVTPQAVSKWENESAKPKIQTIRKMATLWGISVKYILEQGRILRL